MDISSSTVFFAIVIPAIIAVWMRVKIHIRADNLSILDLAQYLSMGVIPVVNLCWIVSMLYDEFRPMLRNTVIIRQANDADSNQLFGLPTWFDVNVHELVTVGKYYAIRRTRNRFGSQTHFYLRYRTAKEKWVTQAEISSGCLTTDADELVDVMAKRGLLAGLPVGGDAVTVNDVIPMLQLAETDSGMKDLLTSAKEWYVLKSATSAHQD